jgi:hypothetical protein
MSTISHYLVSKIIRMWLNVSNHFDHKGFFYFNETIEYGKSKIDRIGKGLIYCEDEIIPVTWGSLKGNHLMSIYSKVKDKKLYFYRESNGRHYKTKLKSNNI